MLSAKQPGLFPSVETLKKKLFACLHDFAPLQAQRLSNKNILFQKVGSTGMLESVSPWAVLPYSAGGPVPKS